MAHIKKNDHVIILAGKDKGKKGKVLVVLPKEDKVMVQGVAISTRHTKAKRSGDVAGIKKQESYIHVSNVKKISE